MYIIHTKLNNKIWNDDMSLNSDVRKNLLQISKDFISFIKIKNIKIYDIVVLGSLANYSWHSKSDVDLHIIFDLSNFKQHEKFIEEYLSTKKTVWNQTHNIYIGNFVVEIYTENKKNTTKANGVFSLIKNSWIVEPIKDTDIKLDKDLIKRKYQSEVSKILYIDGLSKKKNFDYMMVLNDIESYIKKLKEKRSASLKEQGEYSVWNIIFKMLRRNGFIEKLVNLKNDLYDSALTIENNDVKLMETNLLVKDKFILNRASAKLHGRVSDRFKIISENGIGDDKTYMIRNLRIRKDYIVNGKLLNEYLFKNFLTKE